MQLAENQFAAGKGAENWLHQASLHSRCDSSGHMHALPYGLLLDV